MSPTSWTTNVHTIHEIIVIWKGPSFCIAKQSFYRPGRIISVGSDNLSSPTTESERTGVYLWDRYENFCYKSVFIKEENLLCAKRCIGHIIGLRYERINRK